jgi:hypothetical protein
MKRLLQKKLAWGCVVIAISGILGLLPSWDFLPSLWLKIVSGALGILLVVAKAIEMFFDQSAQLEQQAEEKPTDNKP